VNIENLKLNDEQQEIFDIFENTGQNIFITGRAGTGKSHLLQYLRYNSKKRVIVVAPTGMAAINVEGQTIHSLFRFPHELLDKDVLKNINMSQETAFLLKNIDTLIIDEISMVRQDMMDAIDYVLKAVRKNLLPFGGIQVAMFGDPYQLPPVVSDRELHKYFYHNYGGIYFFNAPSYQKASIDIYELRTIIRQEEESFKKLLDDVRHGNVSQELLRELNKRTNTEASQDGIITLTTTNRLANAINSSRLEKLHGETRRFRAEIWGEWEKKEKSSFPADEILYLKKGAQVVFLRNDRQKDRRWVNGTIGCIESLNQSEIKVNIGGIVYPVEIETWEAIKYRYNQEKRKVEKEIVGSFSQYPLKLAWAITIHKSQGQTYDSVIVDMSDNAFVHGQTYVALSRCKRFDKLYIKKGVSKKDIIVDPAVIQFMDSAQITGTSNYSSSSESSSFEAL
jgi:ATP-dependent DNA helicase PIF1